jgi:hypothetical protein
MSDEQHAPIWCYYHRFRIIAHEPRTCDVCTSWKVHYLEHVADGEQSLRDAELERDTVISGSISEERDSLLTTTTALLEQVNTLHNKLDECIDQKNQAIAQVAELTDQLAAIQDERPRKLPRRDPSPCTSVHSELMDGEYDGPRPASAPPQLLSRIQLRGFPDTPVAPEHAPRPSPLPPRKLGFPALIPVIYCRADNSLCAPDGDVPAFPDGQLNFRAHARYVYTTGYTSPDGVLNYQTSLVRSGKFLTPEAIHARNSGSNMPLVGVILGGRDGALISPYKDPRTYQEVDALFSAPEKIRFARGYAERIRYTPPEMRGAVHSYALGQWDNLQSNSTFRPTYAEPVPTMYSAIWKRWLHQKHSEDPQFRYLGIPLVGKGFQNAHVEGNRALLNFLPLNIKGNAIRNGPLRINFLSVAAALLGVPQRYEQVVTQNELPIQQIRRSDPYTEALYGSASDLNIESISRFLACSGVTPEEAEQWRPWATAYIEMALSEYPNHPRTQILKQARDLARQSIADHPAFVIRSVHVDAPGNYNPALEQSRKARGIQIASREQIADTTHPIARPLTPPDFAHTHITQPDEAEIAHTWDDEVISMGPG